MTRANTTPAWIIELRNRLEKEKAEEKAKYRLNVQRIIAAQTFGKLPWEDRRRWSRERFAERLARDQDPKD
jgi:hypothetical protein